MRVEYRKGKSGSGIKKGKCDVIKPGKRAALAMCKESGQTKSLENELKTYFNIKRSDTNTFSWTNITYNCIGQFLVCFNVLDRG